MNSQKVLDFLRRQWLAVGLAVFVVLCLLIGLVNINGTQKRGVQLETQLSAQYLANNNELSTFISTVFEQMGVADRKSAKVEAILVETIKGRYDSANSPKPDSGKLFSAVHEAYPDLTSLSIYDKLADTIAGGRQSYKDVQNKLLDMLANYDSWRKSGIIHRQIVSMAGFPSSTLRAPKGSTVLHGSAAEDQMYNIVLTSQARDAYNTGTQEPLNTNPGSK